MSINISKISDTDLCCADTFNRPISQIEQVLNQLYNKMSGISAGEALVLSGVTVSTDVSIGDLVYRDSTDGICKPAQALLAETPGETGASLEAPCARVIGMVVEKQGIGGSILIGGKYTSITCADNCLGDNAVQGTYYLSSTTPGTAVLDPGASLRQPVLTYWGSGTFSLGLFYMAHDNHFHESLELVHGWYPVSSFSSMIAPDGVSYGYNIEADTSLQELGDLSSDTVTIFQDGLLNTTNFVVTSENIWAVDNPGTDSVVLFTFFPFVYNNPVVRGIVDSGSDFVITSKNGIISIALADFTTTSTAKSNQAVASISGRSLQITPVVSSVSGVGGVKVLSNSSGEAYVGLSSFVDCPLPATRMNMNGTKYTSDDLYTYVVFPANTTSAVTLAYDITDMASDVSSAFAVWINGLVGEGTIAVNMYWVPQPETGTSVVLPTTSDVLSSTTLQPDGTTDGYVYYYESSVASRVSVTGAGTMLATLTMNNTTDTDYRMLSAGFRLYQDTIAQGISEVSKSSIALNTGTAPAGQTILKNMVLTMSGGKLYPASNNIASTADKLVGVALESVSENQDCTYIIQGLHTDTDLGMTEGGLIFVGVAGAMTQTTPEYPAYIQRIGWALTSTTILVDIDSAIGV